MIHSELTSDEYKNFCDLIYRTAGIRIADNKRVMVSNRVRRRLRATGIETFASYYHFLTSPAGGDEMPFFLDAITTNETYFFRDAQHYEWLGHKFLPEIAALAAQRKRRKNLRIWSAACSTGEEPYAIAIELLGKKTLFAGWPITILGSDLSGAALAAARAGSYDSRAVRLIEPGRREAYFDLDKASNRWVIRSEVKSLVTWKQHNLLSALGQEPFDCVFLKNVLIYFDTDSKKIVVRNVIDALAKGAYLVTGPTEGIYAMLDPLKKITPWLYQQPA
jgi:chemotaxis protein methyltransferase CheR